MPPPPRREVFLEFRQIGNCVKATAMDPETLTEVSVLGPATGGTHRPRKVTPLGIVRLLLKQYIPAGTKTVPPP